jgi:Arc/MetJ family transcription regulator
MDRTTLKIDPHLLDLALELSGARTKTEAINLALGDFVRRRERELLRQELGSFDLTFDVDELQRIRRAE